MVKTLIGILNIYSWAVIAITLFFICLIARFYEKKSGQNTHCHLFFLPLVLFLLGAIQYLFSSYDFAGDVVGDTLLFSGGLILSFLGASLLSLMTRGSKR
jgi:hypothetical protein